MNYRRLTPREMRGQLHNLLKERGLHPEAKMEMDEDEDDDEGYETLE